MPAIDVPRRAFLKRLESQVKRTAVISLGGGAFCVGGKLYDSEQAARAAEAKLQTKDD